MEYDNTEYSVYQLFQSKIIWEENNKQSFGNVQKHEIKARNR